MASRQQAIEDALQGFPGFEGFAIGQDHSRQLETRQRPGQRLQIQRRYGFIGDYRHLPSTDMRREKLGTRKETRADMDRVTAFAEFDLKSLHRAPIRKGNRIAQIALRFSRLLKNYLRCRYDVKSKLGWEPSTLPRLFCGAAQALSLLPRPQFSTACYRGGKASSRSRI